MPQVEPAVARGDHRPLLPLGPAAAYLSIGLRTMKALVAAGEIPIVRVSRRRIAVDPRDLDDYIASRRSA